MCWDPDLTANVFDYISNLLFKGYPWSSHLLRIMRSCHGRLKDFNSRLLEVEASISSIFVNYNITSITAVAVGEPAFHGSINVSAANASVPLTTGSQSFVVQDEIAGALKKNVAKQTLLYSTYLLLPRRILTR
jgi:hypothetical protein